MSFGPAWCKSAKDCWVALRIGTVNLRGGRRMGRACVRGPWTAERDPPIPQATSTPLRDAFTNTAYSSPQAAQKALHLRYQPRYVTEVLPNVEFDQGLVLEGAINRGTATQFVAYDGSTFTYGKGVVIGCQPQPPLPSLSSLGFGPI